MSIMHTEMDAHQGLQLLLFFFFQSQRTRSHAMLYALTSLPSLFLTFQLMSMGRPRFSPTGALISPGDDLSQAGLTQYMMDIVFVTWATQIIGCVWSRGWWLYASVGYNAYTTKQFCHSSFNSDVDAQSTTCPLRSQLSQHTRSSS